MAINGYPFSRLQVAQQTSECGRERSGRSWWLAVGLLLTTQAAMADVELLSAERGRQGDPVPNYLEIDNIFAFSFVEYDRRLQDKHKDSLDSCYLISKLELPSPASLKTETLYIPVFAISRLLLTMKSGDARGYRMLSRHALEPESTPATQTVFPPLCTITEPIHTPFRQNLSCVDMTKLLPSISRTVTFITLAQAVRNNRQLKGGIK